MRVYVGQWEMTPHVAQMLAEGDEQFTDNPVSLAAILALVVAVLNESHWRVAAADMVALRVDILDVTIVPPLSPTFNNLRGSFDPLP